MSAKILFSKNGTTGTTGGNTQPLPGTNGDDAKGLPVYLGLAAEFPMEFAFTKSTVDCVFGLEGSLDGTTWSPLAFYRCDTGALVSDLTLSATGRVIVRPFLSLNLAAIRPVAYASAGPAAGDVAVVRSYYRGAVS